MRITRGVSLPRPRTLPSSLAGLRITFGAFVIAWIALIVLAQWLLGSGNILIWVFAAGGGGFVYLEILLRDGRVG